MNAIQQFFELVSARFHEIETMKAKARERGEIIENLTAAYLKGEITAEQYETLKLDLMQDPAPRGKEG